MGRTELHSVAELKARQETPERARANRDKLWTQRKAAMKLRENGKWAANLDDWTPRFEEWELQTLAAAGEVSPDLMALLSPTNKFTVPPEAISVANELHGIHVRIVSEIVSNRNAPARILKA